MLWRVISVAVFAAVSGLGAAHAQTIAQIGDPAELPPPGFKGDQFVDSRGCVFMRISNSGQMQWYPRVSNAHKVVCGYPPTFGAKPKIEMAEETPVPATKPTAVAAAAPVAAANPAPVAATTPQKPVQVAAAPAAKPVAVVPAQTVVSRNVPVATAVAPVAIAAQPAPYVATPPASYQVAVSSGVPQGKIGCYRSAPVAEVVMLRNGGTAVVCTRGDGTATGWRPPIYPANAPVGASLRAPATVRAAAPVAQVAAAPSVAAPVAVAPTYTVPKGYKLAWDDGRLNPQRGVGTAAGQAAQDQIWTRTVPAQLITDDINPRASNAPVYRSTVSVSSMNAPTAPAKPAKAAASGSLWVQVGSFGVPANAQGAADRLSSMGLPVGKSKMTKGGKQLQIVFAGPFGSSADAQAAVRLAHQAGFSDAFVR